MEFYNREINSAFKFESKPEERPERKRIAITGGTEGIGRAITEELLSKSEALAVCARSEGKLRDLEKSAENIFAYQVDLADRDQARQFVQETINDLGGLDLLILNAAIPGVPHENETPEQTQARKEAVFKVNEVAPVALTHAAVEELRKNKGTVVFLTSGLARVQVPGSEDYGRSKKRVEEFLDDFMNRPGNEMINYFSVSPGAVDTRMHVEIAEHGPEPLSKISQDLKKRGALSDPGVVGKIIAKMATQGKKFNPATQKYDILIGRGEIVEISKENIKFESESAVK